MRMRRRGKGEWRWYPWSGAPPNAPPTCLPEPWSAADGSIQGEESGLGLWDGSCTRQGQTGTAAGTRR